MAWNGQELENTSTMVLMPHLGKVSTEWAIRFRELQLPPISSLHILRYYPIDVAREAMAKAFVNSREFQWSLWLDSDVIPPIDGVMRLLAHKNLPIVAGIYPAKKRETPEKYPSAWKKVQHPNSGSGFSAAPMDWNNHGLHVVDYIGFGFVKIHRSVFESMPQPWFLWTHDRSFPLPGNPPPLSEDFYWSEKVRSQGYTIIVDMDVRCAHDADAVIDEEGKLILARA